MKTFHMDSNAGVTAFSKVVVNEVKVYKKHKKA